MEGVKLNEVQIECNEIQANAMECEFDVPQPLASYA